MASMIEDLAGVQPPPAPAPGLSLLGNVPLTPPAPPPAPEKKPLRTVSPGVALMAQQIYKNPDLMQSNIPGGGQNGATMPKKMDDQGWGKKT